MVKIIQAQPIPKSKISPDELLSRFCLTYPQYTYKQAKNMPYKRLVKMMMIARKVHAEKMIELIQVAQAPHTDKQKGVKKMIEYYKGIMEENNG